MHSNCTKTGLSYHRNIEISLEIHKDLHWWCTFLQDYNGISCISSEIWSRSDEIFSSDICLTGCRACSSTHYLQFELPSYINEQGHYINQYELYVILISVREWVPQFQNKNILVYCDNHTSVNVLHSCRVNCTFMQKCFREIRYHSAKFNFTIRAVYLYGEENKISDSLSRWYLLQSYREEIFKATKNLNLSETIVLNFTVNDYW